MTQVDLVFCVHREQGYGLGEDNTATVNTQVQCHGLYPAVHVRPCIIFLFMLYAGKIHHPKQHLRCRETPT